MKTNAKVAPMSCYCKLSVLIAHLKSMSAKKMPTGRKDLNNLTHYSDTLANRYM